MKANVLIRCISFLLLFFLNACQPASLPPSPTATSVSPTPEISTPSPPIAPTETVPALPTATSTREPEPAAGEIAYAHVEAISQGIGPRVAGTAEETRAAQYIISELEGMGYTPEMQPFTVTVRENVIDSANIVAVKQGVSPLEMIVGAHYDSAGVGTGADDNATGVGVMLEVAERIREQETPYTIRFLFFGAEEAGLQGSQYYVGQMTEEQIQNTVAMINLDSLTAGDFAYIYGDEGERGKIRDWALAFTSEHELALQTQAGENPDYPAGTTGDWSDHAPFKQAGIPYAYLEATNWTLGEKDGYTQVSAKYGENGKIWHTEYDTLDYINASFPGRIPDRLHLFVTLLEAILTEADVSP